jgi:hypothetical protein
VIAGENDGEGFGVSEVFEGIVAAIDPRQIEIWRGRAEREDWVVRFFGSLERQEKERCEEKGAQVHRSWAEHTLWGRGVNVRTEDCVGGTTRNESGGGLGFFESGGLSGGMKT